MESKSVRRKTKAVFIGHVQIGGDAPVVVQSMTSTDTRDVKATVKQILALEAAGCEIIRVAVPDSEAASCLRKIKGEIDLPLIADIHFNADLALEAISQGADAIRINPGNIRRDRLKKVVLAAKDRGICIRIGVNSGSLEKELLKKYGGVTPDALVESAISSIDFFEGLGFSGYKVSLKSSNVPDMISAYRKLALKIDCPFHLGVTEAGTLLQSAIKSAIGIGVLLSDGIGDTIRVSVTGDPVQEIPVCYGILRALGIRRFGPDIISCPTCGRCEFDLPKLVDDVQSQTAGMRDFLKIAIMGCVVNGPGEAAEADVGIAGGRGAGILFRKGKKIKKVNEDSFAKTLLDEIDLLIAERKEKGDAIF